MLLRLFWALWSLSSDSELSELEPSESDPEPELELELELPVSELESSELLSDPLELLESEPEEESESELEPEEFPLSANVKKLKVLCSAHQISYCIMMSNINFMSFFSLPSPS